MIEHDHRLNESMAGMVDFEDKEGRQDLICVVALGFQRQFGAEVEVFEYVLTYNSQWFEQDDKHRM